MFKLKYLKKLITLNNNYKRILLQKGSYSDDDYGKIFSAFAGMYIGGVIIKSVGTIVVIGGGIYGFYRGGKWIFKRFKNNADTNNDKMIKMNNFVYNNDFFILII